MSEKKISALDKLTNRATTWIGSTTSLIIHTIFFAIVFVLVAFGLSLDTVLLILTTVVSLEAIYLAIFIQRSVNQQQESIAEEFDDLEEAISEDIDETEAALRKDLDDTEQNIFRDLDDTEKNISQDIDESEAEISKDIDETEAGIKRYTPKAIEKPLDDVIEELRTIIREEVRAALKEKK
jgi:ABC-type multidrug transport system fused ATPase/permease subunit